MKSRLAVAVVVIGLASVTVAQVKLVDNSPASSPLSFVGLTQTPTGTCLGTIHNRDARPVVGIVVDFSSEKISAYVLHDHFFRDADYIKLHGTDIDVFFGCHGAKTVNMRTVFVQFNDGTVWEGNDPKATAQIVTERRETTDALNELAAKDDVRAALATKPGPTKRPDGSESRSKQQVWWMLKQETDPVAAISDRLGHAAEHANWLNSLQ